MKQSSGVLDCSGWYLDFMDEMRGFETQPASVETLKEMKSRFANAINQVDELVRLQQLGINKQCSCWDGHSAIRHEGIHASFQPLKPKKFKKIKSKLKKVRFKPAKLRPVKEVSTVLTPEYLNTVMDELRHLILNAGSNFVK